MQHRRHYILRVTAWFSLGDDLHGLRASSARAVQTEREVTYSRGWTQFTERFMSSTVHESLPWGLWSFFNTHSSSYDAQDPQTRCLFTQFGSSHSRLLAQVRHDSGKTDNRFWPGKKSGYERADNSVWYAQFNWFTWRIVSEMGTNVNS